MTPTWLLVGYCVLVACASLAGGMLPTLIRMTHLRTQLLMSFVSGLMLGIAVLHLLPHSIEILGSSSRAAHFSLGGIIGMFLLLRAFHVHSHGEPSTALPMQSLPVATDTLCPVHSDLCEHEHEHGQQHEHEHGHGHGHERGQGQHARQLAMTPANASLGWLGMLFGLGLHTMMDGVALAASVAADASHGPWLGLAGLGTFLAVALHKPLDAFAIGSVMRKSGWSSRERKLVNGGFSLACPIGAALFWLGVTRVEWESGLMIGCGLALSAGFFICIALADLLPEVHFHDHDRVKLTLALFLGVALAVGIESLPGHQHGAVENGHAIHREHQH